VNVFFSNPEIWAYPEDLENLKTNPYIVYSLRSRHLKILGTNMINMIEKERDFNKYLNKLSDVLHRDDPWRQELDFEKDLPPTAQLTELKQLVQVRKISTCYVF